ncbi:MAG: hypothetical protein LBL62_06470 [Planctomycetaceae bacterium]|nr:hypothetical protein [Planctomycetaceae bacterium]
MSPLPHVNSITEYLGKAIRLESIIKPTGATAQRADHPPPCNRCFAVAFFRKRLHICNLFRSRHE